MMNIQQRQRMMPLARKVLLSVLCLGIVVFLPARPSSSQDINPEFFPVTMTSPAEGTILAQPDIHFEWEQSHSPEASYRLWVGTEWGRADIFAKDLGQETAVVVPNIPLYGETVFVRLWAKVGEQWLYQDYRYPTMEGGMIPASIVSPTNGTLLSEGNVEFRRDGGRGGTGFWLTVGYQPGGKEIFNADFSQGQSLFVKEIPLAGELIYARLWSRTGNDWTFRDMVYSTVVADQPVMSGGHAAPWMVSPANGTFLDGTSVSFEWNPVPGASQYLLKAGTLRGQGDIFRHSVSRGTSVVAKIDPSLSRFHVQLRAKVKGQWIDQNYLYFTKKAMVETAKVQEPLPGSTLRHTSAAFEWPAVAEAEEYQLAVGSEKGARDIYFKDLGQTTYAQVEGIPCDGQAVHVRLGSKIGNEWFYEDHTYGTEDIGLEPALISQPVPGTVLATSRIDFAWDRGQGVTEYRLDVGTAQGGRDLFTRDLGGQSWATVESIPQNGAPVFVRLWSRVGEEWAHTDYEYKTEEVVIIPGEITRVIHTPSGTETTLVMEWESVQEAIQYRLQVGSRPGQGDLYDHELGGQTTAVVTGIDHLSVSVVYVRLWSGVGESWTFRDSVFRSDEDYHRDQ